MLKGKYFIIFNALWFQLCWWLAILFQTKSIPWLFALIALHFVLSSSKHKDAKWLLLVLIGLICDQLLVALGFYNFHLTDDNIVGVLPFNLVPIWLICLWIAFCLCLNHSLKFVFNLSIIPYVLILAVGGTMSYFAAYKFDAVIFIPLNTTLFLIFIYWASIISISSRILNKKIHHQ